mgnify:CR=1 FL=1
MKTAEQLMEHKKLIQRLLTESKIDRIIEDVTKSIEEGFMGKTFGFHLTKIEQDLLENEHGFKTKTFCSNDDDMFEECSVWIEE